MDTVAYRLTPDFLTAVGTLIGVEANDMFENTPILIMTQTNIATFEFRFLSEDQAHTECEAAQIEIQQF